MVEGKMASSWGFAASRRSSNVEMEEKSIRGYDSGSISWGSLRQGIEGLLG